MTETRQIAVVRSNQDLLELGRLQVQALRATYDMLDRYTGHTQGFWSKALAACDYSSSGKRGSKRGLSAESFDAMLVWACCDLIAVENPQKVARLQAWMAKNLERRVGPVVERTADTYKPVIIRFSRKHMRKLSKLATEGRKKIPLWKRRQLARKAGRASALKRAGIRSAGQDRHNGHKSASAVVIPATAPRSKPDGRSSHTAR